MSLLAGPEDAASLLEQFIHDVANTPAEITHLLEEIQAKDMQIQTFKDEINKRDAQLQKWVRVSGGHVLNPKEDAFSETVKNCYDKCEILQAEKCGLSEKALIVLDRQIKRLDIGLRSLQAREEFPPDWGGPSLLSGTATGTNTPATGGGGAIPSGPLQAVSGNAGGGTPNVANAAQIRMAQAVAGRTTNSGASTPSTIARSQREGSSEATKRRRLNATLGALPAVTSNLRQTSLGPGTPKAGTPVPSAQSGSRAGSAQPTQKSTAQKKAPAASQPSRKVAPHQAAANNKNSKRARNATKKPDRKRQLTRDRATPSTNASLSDDDEDSSSPTPSSHVRSQGEGADERTSRRGATAEEDDDEENDDQLYCYCQKVSFGDMVGCDNDNCEYQWFHWDCVGLKSEPEGEWLCPTCKKLPKSQVVISKA